MCIAFFSRCWLLVLALAFSSTIVSGEEPLNARGVEQEALGPFEAGRALFAKGQFLEAAEKFTDAYTTNDKFGDAVLWEARCYEAVGLPELAEAMRHYQRTALVGVGVSANVRLTPEVVNVEPPRPAPLPPLVELEEQLQRAGVSRAGNIPHLQLVLKDPANGLVAGRVLQKPGDPRTGVSGFLNHALRDHLVAVLPKQSAQRAWLQLMQIQRFTEQVPIGRAVAPRLIEPRPALADFIAAHPDDLPGAVAEYFLLRDTCDEMPADRAAERFDALQARLVKTPGEGELGGFALLQDYTNRLAALARIAAGREKEPQLPENNLPYFLTLSLDNAGRPMLARDYAWGSREWSVFQFSPEESVSEARAALAIAGAPNRHFKVADQWLKLTPPSVFLASYCASAIGEVEGPTGEPFLHPFDAAAEKASYRALVDYARRGLIYWMKRASTAQQMDELEESVRRVVMFTCAPVYAETITDAEQLAWRDELIKEMAVADARVTRRRWSVLNESMAPWRQFTRAFARKHNSFRATGTSIAYFDQAQAQEMLADGGREAFDDTTSFNAWWTRVRSYQVGDTLSPGVVANAVVKHAEELGQLFRGPELNEREMGALLDYGTLMIDGGQFAESERVLRQVLAVPLGGADREETTDALRASAAYLLGLLNRQAGQDERAAQYARQALELAGEKNLRLLLRYNAENPSGGTDYFSENKSDLRGHVVRLLTDLRTDPAQLKLPERVGVVVVPTKNLDNARLRVYYRLPPGADQASQPLPVLVLAEAFNTQVLSDLLPDSAWARWADEAGVVLVAPEFFAHKWAVVKDPPAIAGYGFPQAWSGDALLAALAKIGERASIRQTGLLLHGYGEGASFCARLARWKPELCRAVSGHSTSSFPWAEEVNGLRSLQDVKGVPFLVTCGEMDGAGLLTGNRLAVAEQFATMARGAGVPVLYRSWPGVYHVKAPEMEELSRAFLRAHASVEAPAGGFIGDRRTWQFSAAQSAAAEAIPPLFREELPSREVALQWGKEVR